MTARTLRRLLPPLLLAPAVFALSATQASAAGETLTLVQNDAGAITGHATNFTASGSLNPDDTMFGFDIFIFAKNPDKDPTCAADFDSESANATHSGGNETWISPATGYQVGYGPTFNQPFKITFTAAWQLSAVRLRPGRLLHVRDRPAARDRRARSGDRRRPPHRPPRPLRLDSSSRRPPPPRSPRSCADRRSSARDICSPASRALGRARRRASATAGRSRDAAAPSPPRASSPFAARSRAATSCAA